MLQFIKFDLFDINTGDKLHEIDDMPIFIPKTLDVFKYLKQIYPMFDISLYRVGTINTMIGLSDEQKNALTQSQIDNHGDNLLDALCLGTPVDNDTEIDSEHYNPGLSTPDYKGE